MPDQILNHLDADRDGAIKRQFALLRIESVSTDPAYKSACKDAADWLVKDLENIGFAASWRDTTAHPLSQRWRKPPTVPLFAPAGPLMIKAS